MVRPLAPRLFKKAVWVGIITLTMMVGLIPAFMVFDRYSPPKLMDSATISTQVVDADNRLLRAFANDQGRWRLRLSLDDVDPEFVELLIAYEDQRFWNHNGVDPMAMGRAAIQFAKHRRIVSGGSTITMQLARLIEHRNQRSITSKFWQILRALQLEMRLSKQEILELYLTLAPYGGNLEGLRAASLAWFGKEPKELSLDQAAMLVALPQAPEQRRPDRHPNRAKRARDTVLKRVAALGTIATSEVDRAAQTKAPTKRRALPNFAPHLTERVVASAKQRQSNESIFKVTLKRRQQQVLEKIAVEAARQFDRNVSIAMVLADARTGAVLAEVGSSDYMDVAREGWVDMTRAVRSPGSALKPFIYGLAFEEGLIRSETLIVDAPSNFANYRPQNFDLKYQGEVSVRRALQLSLNVPAVHLLESVGPTRLTSRFRSAGVKMVLPGTKQPSLAIGLGGIGITLRDLTQLYTGLANGGQVTRLHDGSEQRDDPSAEIKKLPLLQEGAAWHVTKILSGTTPPAGASKHNLAYKTGTSYGYRDAWSVGYDGGYVLGVWVGRADNGPVPGITGRSAAAPILFEAFSQMGLASIPFRPAPEGTSHQTLNKLPITLRRFKPGFSPTHAVLSAEPAPRIVYPPNGSEIELGSTAIGETLPLVLKLQDGRPPFRWLVNGKIIRKSSRERISTWIPDSLGFSHLTVIDAQGRTATVNVYLGK